MKRTILYFAAVAIMALVFASCERNDIELTTPGDNDSISQDTPTGPGEWVDLGLPSGLLWYSCNLGANAPEEYGDYYAWGEIEPKSEYTWATYRYATVDSNGNAEILSKYNSKDYWGPVDNLTTLEPEDDAATVILANGARIPTESEWRELLANTTRECTTMNNVHGVKFTADNGNVIFLPAAGYSDYDTLNWEGHVGFYWASDLELSGNTFAYDFEFDWGSNGTGYTHQMCRYNGQSIRPVKSGNKK
ncbi:MAG: hypothetical protein J5711_02960 [Bacteroidales bacterium]|nr:hypothetical protein [Bacteroidales bacterium]